MEGPGFDQEDRDFFDKHFQAIADRLAEKKIFGFKRARYWTNEANGVVYKFGIDSYAKKGTPLYIEREHEKDLAVA